MSDIAVASRSQNDKKKNQISLQIPRGAESKLYTKETGISRKTSAFIEGRNRADWEVPAYFARGGTGWYGTLKVKLTIKTHVAVPELTINTHLAILKLTISPIWQSLNSP